MPKAAALKQKNKPHKGPSKSIAKRKKEKVKPQSKTIRKRVKITTKLKKTQIRSKAKKLDQEIKQVINKNQAQPAPTKEELAKLMHAEQGCKIIALIPFNDSADVSQIQSSMQEFLQGMSQSRAPMAQKCSIDYNYLRYFFNPEKHQGLPRQNFLIVDAGRDPVSVLDICKVADIICPVLSCKKAQTAQLKLNPDLAQAFQQWSYDLIREMRSQGMPPTCCLLQDLDVIDPRHQSALKKLFARFYESEFGKGQPLVQLSIGWQNRLLRQLGNIKPFDPEWKRGRAHMLVESTRISQGGLVCEGVLRGGPLNANQLVHLTGVGDFQQASIELLDSASKIDRAGKPFKIKLELPIQHSYNPESLNPFADKLTSLQQRDLDINEALQELGIAEQVMQEEIEQQDDQQAWEDDLQPLPLLKKQDFMEKRSPQDLDFQDEVQYGADILVSERYKKYRGMKSFRTSEFNARENLPS